MKKNLLITLALGLLLFSCQKSDMLPTDKAGYNIIAPELGPSPVPAEITCQLYSIFNPHGPTGATIEYSYLDCDGLMHTGFVDPLQTVMVKAIPGSVKCPGGIVTEMK